MKIKPHNIILSKPKVFGGKDVGWGSFAWFLTADLYFRHEFFCHGKDEDEQKIGFFRNDTDKEYGFWRSIDGKVKMFHSVRHHRSVEIGEFDL